MDFFTILAIALGLSFDTFAVSLSYGVVLNTIKFRQAIRVAIILAVFQGGLAVAGYFLGSIFSNELKTADHWIALGLLAFLGIKMIVEGKRKSNHEKTKDFSSTVVLLTIALGTSIDAFAVGSMTAIRIGKSAGERLGNKVEIVGGLILIGIGLKIFIEHMFG